MFSEQEQAARRQLTHAYWILAKLGLDDHTYTHLSVRSVAAHCFYIYPFGLRFSEATPHDLLEVDHEGTIVYGQECTYNRTGYIIHGQIYQGRPDARAIFHVHAPEIVAVSACADGLLPLSQWALHFYERLAYHAYDSLALNPHQGQAMLSDLADKSVMFLRNHGALVVARTIQEAMFYTYHLYQACKTQCLALSMGQKLVYPERAVCEQAVHDLLHFESDLGARDWRAWLRWIGVEEQND